MYLFSILLVWAGERQCELKSELRSVCFGRKCQNIQQEASNGVSKIIVGYITTSRFHLLKQEELIGSDVIKSADISRAIIYADGGSRGNPGPSASGFVIMNEQEHVIHEGGMYLGITTNNQAEYHGVRLGLEKALEMGARTVDFRLDSLLVVNQMNGIYQDQES